MIDDDPRKRHLRVRGVPVRGSTDDLADVVRLDRGPHRHPGDAERRQGAGPRDQPRRARPRGGPQGPARADAAPLRPRRRPRHPRPEPHRPARPQPARHRHGVDRGLPDRPAGARHRRRRLDRVRAVPPDQPVRSRRADDARPRRVRPARRPAVAERTRAPGLRRRGALRHPRPGRARADLRRAATPRRLPRGRAQAPADARAVPRRGREDQRHRHPQRPRRGARRRGGALRQHLHRQGRQPREHARLLQAHRRAAHVHVRRPGAADDEHLGALRQRAGQPRLGADDVRRADRARRPDHRHRTPRSPATS